MPETVKITKPLGPAVVSPTIRWPAQSRLSEADKAAMSAYTKEVETTIRALSESVRELQAKLDGKALG
jgi:hypothetical protein